jgi:hypothetical protein
MEPMTPKVTENKAFANCFRDWIAVIQQNHAPVERTLPENIAGADGQEHLDGAHLLGPKLRAGSGGFSA